MPETIKRSDGVVLELSAINFSDVMNCAQLVDAKEELDKLR